MTAIHGQAFEGAGKTYELNAKGIDVDGKKIRVEDYWDRVFGESWMFANGVPAAIAFAVRSAVAGLPIDDDVVYGKVDGIGHIVHVSELGEIAS
jgi:hypothetical protein